MTTRRILVAAAMAAALVPALYGARKVVRTRVVVSKGHPIRRPIPQVVVRRTAVVVSAVTYAPAVVWAPVVIALPARERLVWEDSERIERDEDWVESNFGVNNRGRALVLNLQGRAQLNFAEVIFGNGQAQVVDFNERVREPGTYMLLDFKDGREVKAVRIIARSRTPNAKLTVYMEK